MESEEENAPSVDGFLEEVTLNGSLKNEVEGSRGGLSGKGMVGRDGGGKGEVSNSMVCGSQWCVNSGAGSGELRVEPGEVEQGLPRNRRQLSVHSSPKAPCWTTCTWPSLSGPTHPPPCLTLCLFTFTPTPESPMEMSSSQPLNALSDHSKKKTNPMDR